MKTFSYLVSLNMILKVISWATRIQEWHIHFSSDNQHVRFELSADPSPQKWPIFRKFLAIHKMFKCENNILIHDNTKTLRFLCDFWFNKCLIYSFLDLEICLLKLFGIISFSYSECFALCNFILLVLLTFQIFFSSHHFWKEGWSTDLKKGKDPTCVDYIMIASNNNTYNT